MKINADSPSPFRHASPKSVQRPRQLTVRTPEQLALIARAWNESHPLGTPVIYHPIIGDNEGRRETETTSDAFVLAGHTVCVFVQGVSGCVALEAIEVGWGL